MTTEIVNLIFNIGKLSLFEWFTAFNYLLAFFVTFQIYKHNQVMLFEPDQVRQKYFWLMVSILFFILALYKLFGIQDFITHLFREQSSQEGWYADRRSRQSLFIFGVSMIAFMVLILIIIIMRNAIEKLWQTILGCLCLMSFIAIRTISFHNFDAIIYKKIAFISINSLLELGLIIMTALPAYKLLYKYRHKTKIGRLLK